jgi:tRNA-splicing ligase RtcB
MFPIGDKIMAWIDPARIEVEAMRQIQNTASLPFIYKHVAVMADCHYGKGSTVGTVIATQGAIIPACVGVDISCGMVAARTCFTSNDLPASLRAMREGIERRVPASVARYNSKIQETAIPRVQEMESRAGVNGAGIEYYDRVDHNWRLELGSLGSGNHFIEVCLDEKDRVWVVLHSGSRGIGNKLATKHIDRAKRLMESMFITLVDPDLAYLPDHTPAFGEYIRDVLWAQHFALLNRDEMMDRVLEELRRDIRPGLSTIEEERINAHHNFLSQENQMGRNVWVTRKGAVRARVDDLSILPGSMASATYIVRGKGNIASFQSAPHGAGRRMSRGQARKTITMEDFRASMAGIEYRDDPKLLDEARDAYKPIAQVMADSEELVEVVHELHQVLNVKGD